jgi:undecaprenyl-diphosphatase
LAGWVLQAESRLLGAVALGLIAGLVFALLASEVVEGDTRAFDDWVLEVARARIVGGADSTVSDIALNVTALGGYPVLVVVVTGVLGFLLLEKRRWQALYVLVATAGGGLLSDGLKVLFERPRPAPFHLPVGISSWSFPSGHALSSAVVYLTLGSLVAANLGRRRAKIYVLVLALAIAGVVGLSRVALGVHYPTDVLAGWLAGLAWALACWVGFELLERRPRS